ncbi:nucleoside/nucleotide kinase family protein [Wenjunlia vitaminophila]|uniref:uridine kinase n=1 Tax=Wenjunlia vitaminophila TaxID=76728 RepID=UPI0003A36CF9|nr:uridine kinase [Wenjunlia vitaminophila]
MGERVPRAALVGALVELLVARSPERVLRVAVDGPDAAGKTTLADELARNLSGRREAIRVGIDGFHRPRSVRLRRGSLSPEGFYHDSFDHDAVRRTVLDPLGPGGDRRYRTAVFDHRVDAATDEPARVAPEGAVLLFDGVFVLRPELREHWDVSIFVDVSEEEALRRALVRDAVVMGGPDVVRERYERRYLPGQRLYRGTAAPELAADVVIDNNDPARPRVVKWTA